MLHQHVHNDLKQNRLRQPLRSLVCHTHGLHIDLASHPILKQELKGPHQLNYRFKVKSISVSSVHVLLESGQAQRKEPLRIFLPITQNALWPHTWSGSPSRNSDLTKLHLLTRHLPWFPVVLNQGKPTYHLYSLLSPENSTFDFKTVFHLQLHVQLTDKEKWRNVPKPQGLAKFELRTCSGQFSSVFKTSGDLTRQRGPGHDH